MIYVVCPCCKERIAIPPSAIGPDRTDSWNVAVCDDCDAAFCYDDEEIIETAEPGAL